MKNVLLLFLLITLGGCYFGANEYSSRITRDFYLISWDNKFWQISRSTNTSEFHTGNILIKHDVFGVGHNKNFIIAIQHPCEEKKPHLTDYNHKYSPNKEITNYFIIELLDNKKYRINKYDRKIEYLEARKKLQVPEDLDYTFYRKDLE